MQSYRMVHASAGRTTRRSLWFLGVLENKKCDVFCQSFMKNDLLVQKVVRVRVPVIPSPRRAPWMLGTTGNSGSLTVFDAVVCLTSQSQAMHGRLTSLHLLP